MKLRTVLVASAAGLAVAGILTVIGLVMTTNSSFARTYVAEQLGQQRITFTTVDRLTAEEKASPCLMRYAGQQLTTGKQAECYANAYIGLHLKSIAGGKTYAELREPEMALMAKVTAAEKAGDPALPALQKELAAIRAQRGVLFQGETSRGLLLTAFGFSDLGIKAGQAATAAYTAAALLALLSVGSLARGLTAARKNPSVVTAREVATADSRQLVGA